MKTVGGAAVGVIFWLAAQFLSLGLADGGDGWDGPALLSLALIPVYPLVIAGLFARQTNVRIGAVMLIVVALLDAVLFYNMVIQEPGYFAKARDVAPVAVYGWITLWAGWQVMALAVLVRSARAERFGATDVR